MLGRYGIAATSHFVDVPAIGGSAHVLVAGEGPPLVMVIGGTIPAAFWAPLMPQLRGYTLYAMDLPGFGLTGAVTYQTATMRSTVVGFLAQVLDGIAPTYGTSLLALMNAVMRRGRARPEIALTGEQLAQVRHPVQMIWGDRDPFGSLDVARHAAAFLPDPELHVVPGGHAPWFHRSEQVGALARRFFADHPDRG